MSKGKESKPELSAFLSTEGEMSRLTRELDWSKTVLGPMDKWPQGLKTALNIMLGSRYAMWLGWGSELIFFYNDAYAQMTLGPKHPWALGRPASEVWSEIWEDIGPRAESVLETGVATWDEGLLLFLERQGFAEETYHTFSYSPLPSDDGTVGGMLCVVTEDTERTIGERRLRTLRELAARMTEETQSAEKACEKATLVLESNPQDLPFAMIYLLDSDGRRASLAGLSGIRADSPASPTSVDLEANNCPWPLLESMCGKKDIVLENLNDIFEELPVGVWPDSPNRAVVLRLAESGQAQTVGFLVVGISPRLAFDERYRGFLELLTGQIVTAVAHARAYDEERRRAEALAELDRAKTTFFSNVSHEFRTPLTLMLGPVEDMLSGSDVALPVAARGQLEVVNRNGLRLLRLVNSLLDFSRIEAGRVRAIYQETDLSKFTADLAAVFRSAVERAGLQLTVNCSELSEPAFVDREMWEKIVLNLLSNAFKFTFAGDISITLHQQDEFFQLQVRDTGIGIAPEEMPRLFERFHRIDNARGRTHEGSGIGLALVQELVKLHGGTITAKSIPDKGTTFVVTIPLGSAHLRKEQIGDREDQSMTSNGTNPYLEEALRWLPDDSKRDVSNDANSDSGGESSQKVVNKCELETGDTRPLILIADDNQDMRQYVARLLDMRYRVIAVADGIEALEATRSQRPQLILSDVMMPRLDGFGLLQELRADPQLSDIPIIMLSARAGEESRVEGMEAGADDYLVKPFSARELLARVRAHLQMAAMRIESARSLRESEERLQLALRASHMVVWQWELNEDRVQVSDTAVDTFGLPAGFSIETSQQFFSLIHPDDLEAQRMTVQQAIDEAGSYLSQYRIFRQDTKELRWLEERGHVVVGESGSDERVIAMVMDITERRATEEKLRERESFLQAIVDTTPECIKLVASDGRLLQMNSAGLEMVGAESAADVSDGCAYTLVAPEFREQFKSFNQQICRGERGRLDFDIIGLNGVRRHMETHAVPLAAPDGALLQLGLTRDVTDRKKAEEALRRERDLLSVTLASIGDGVITTDMNSHIIQMNRVAQTLTGWAMEDAEGLPLDTVFKIVDEHSREPVENPVVQSLREGVVVNVPEHTLLLRKDGSECPIDESVAPIRDEHGELAGSVLVFRDVTERRRAEAALLESESYFRSMANNSPTMLWITENDGSCSFLSRGWYEYTGQREAEGFGEGGFGRLKAVHPDDREVSERIFNEANVSHKPFAIDYRLRCADGEYRWAIDSGRPRFDESGKFLGFIGSVIDVHERKLAQDFRTGQAHILEMITSERSLNEILAALVFFIEWQIPGSFGSILLLDSEGKHLRHGAAPRLPEQYNEMIDGVAIGPQVGSCGTAVYRGDRVVVENIASDPLWSDYKDLATRNGLAACWSQPIPGSNGAPLGTTAIYFSAARAPQPEELGVLEATAHFAGIAIERLNTQVALRNSEKRLRALTNATSDVVFSMSADWTEMRPLDTRELKLDMPQSKQSWLETYIPHEDRPVVTAAITKAIESKNVFELEHRVVRADGTFGWISSRAIPILDENGNIDEWFGTASDVTRRKETEEKLRINHRELSRFNRVAVNRELRMIELKKQINELCQRLDEPSRFPLEFDTQSNMAKV